MWWEARGTHARMSGVQTLFGVIFRRKTVRQKLRHSFPSRLQTGCCTTRLCKEQGLLERGFGVHTQVIYSVLLVTVCCCAYGLTPLHNHLGEAENAVPRFTVTQEHLSRKWAQPNFGHHA